MDTITRKLRTGEREFKVYTQAEADAQALPYKHWSECEAGEFALSDDGWVAELWASKPYADRAGKLRYALRLAYGDYWYVPSARTRPLIKYEDKRGTGLYSHSKPMTWDQREIRSGRGKRLVRAYVAQWMNGKIDYTHLGQIYRKDQAIPEATVKRVLKSKTFMDAIENEIEKLMVSKGVTKDYVIDIMKEAVEMAKEARNPDILLKAAKDFRTMLGMDPQRKMISETMEYSNIKSLEDKLDTETVKLNRTGKEI